ncbi:hypothetical protein [Nocardioides aequoreus]|uniref:divisome protein SepX/GlpR n=1 Tax=Nocardioides aequoreus TaxID=397278 RepID=UPI0004C3B21F|nr:hypothetical protein [Nocardioides aequoreus]
MDLSALIFVVLALAWAVYLIPKALQHHDEVAGERLDESHSERARVLSRRRTTGVAERSGSSSASTDAVESPVEPDAVAEVAPRRVRRSSKPRPELSAAGRAARNRRRVLALLLATLATVWALTWFAYLPAITPLWPSLAVVGWLVVARLSVVQMQRARRARPLAPASDDEAAAPVAGPVREPVQVAAPTPAAPAEPLDSRPEVVAEQQALADDGALWDPLPLTLPTYVGKATARRTVRTIELTGMTSSGHDAADSALAREAEATRTAATTAEQRRAAGA